MRRPLFLLLAACLAVSACGGWRDSGLNPGNWFGGSREVAAAQPVGPDNPLIPPQRRSILARPEAADLSVPVEAIREMRVDRAINGAIVTATGVAARQGAFAPELRPLDPELRPDENGVLSFTFRVLYPEDATPQGSERTRTLTAAVSLSNDELAGVRLIRVSGNLNARESRRN